MGGAWTVEYEEDQQREVDLWGRKKLNRMRLNRRSEQKSAVKRGKNGGRLDGRKFRGFDC